MPAPQTQQLKDGKQAGSQSSSPSLQHAKSLPHSFSDSALAVDISDLTEIDASLDSIIDYEKMGGDRPLLKSASEPCISSTPHSFENLCLSDIKSIQVIGTGTFSKVHLVKHLNQFYALKVVPKRKLKNAKQRDGIKSERDILLSINHEYIVKMHTTFQDDDHLYMLMEFAQGGELFYHLRNQGAFEEGLVRFYAAEIAMALSHLHEQGIVYRDLKLENLVLASSGHVRITDFGFARKLETKSSRTFTVCGTAEYLAPELLLGKGYNYSVDWWALGVLIFEMMSGYSPFYDENPTEIYRNILYSNIEFPEFISGPARDFIKRLLTRDTQKRLGCSSAGTQAIFEHPWFEGFDWQNPTPPFVPKLSDQGDASFFEVEIDENEFDDLDGSGRKERLSADGADIRSSWFEGF
eukprot:TRINITY_DN14766_c0_g1_i2.p1 TRINITY_DN14766_c0_g1~~TRINITY_DN14766_c0_g1_i2.p1  ORF type:complete len:409 (-),score=114.69 TRINITY_DN14766_c0_g1_i2:73-1299(-)